MLRAACARERVVVVQKERRLQQGFEHRLEAFGGATSSLAGVEGRQELGLFQRIERANQSVVDMAQKLEAPQADLRRLRGQIDELNYENDSLRKRQREL